MYHLRWKQAEITLLENLWPNVPTDKIAELLNRSSYSVWAKAKKMGLQRSPEFIEDQKKFFVSNLLKHGVKTRFSKGTQAHNKGKRQCEFMSKESIEKSKATRFKKRQKPHNTKPIGYERITRDGYTEVKTQNLSGAGQFKNFKLKHRLVYEMHYGKLPEGFVVKFRDGNKQNFAIENLYAISIADNLIENALIRSTMKLTKEEFEWMKINKPELLQQKYLEIKLNQKIKQSCKN
jgi:hypothetical protein